MVHANITIYWYARLRNGSIHYTYIHNRQGDRALRARILMYVLYTVNRRVRFQMPTYGLKLIVVYRPPSPRKYSTCMYQHTQTCDSLYAAYVISPVREQRDSYDEAEPVPMTWINVPYELSAHYCEAHQRGHLQHATRPKLEGLAVYLVYMYQNWSGVSRPLCSS